MSKPYLCLVRRTDKSLDSISLQKTTYEEIIPSQKQNPRTLKNEFFIRRIGDEVFTGRFIGKLTANKKTIVIKPNVSELFFNEMLPHLVGLYRTDESGTLAPEVDLSSDILIMIWKLLAKKSIAKGLLKSYITITEKMNRPKGKIRFDLQISKMNGLPHPVYTLRKEHSYDNALNRLILAAAKALTNSFKKSNGKNKPAEYSCTEIIHNLKNRGVTEVKPYRAVEEFSTQWKWTHPESRSKYEMLATLSLKLLQRKGMRIVEGPMFQFNYLIDMAILFESYVVAVLKKKLSGGNIRVGSAESLFEERNLFDENLKGYIYPDCLVLKDDEPLIVIDCKYKKMELDNIVGHFDNPDRHQIITYMAVYDCPGMLIYPKWVDDYPNMTEYKVAPFDSAIEKKLFIATVPIPGHEWKSDNQKKKELQNKLIETHLDKVVDTIRSQVDLY